MSTPTHERPTAPAPAGAPREERREILVLHPVPGTSGRGGGRVPRLPRPDRPRGGLSGWVAARWASLDAEVVDRRVPGTMIVAVLALAVGLAAAIWTAVDGSNLAYADAQSHLTIARRIFDSKTPGFQQLGTVWLPMPHLLLVPFVQSLWLWHTGLAGGLLGALCLMVTVVGVYRITARLQVGRTGRIAAVLVFLANPGVLYTYSTALTEPVLLAALAATFAGLAHWATSPRRMSGGELAVFAGIPAAISVLSRYEGWALVLGGTAFVAIVAFRRDRSWRFVLRMTFSFVAIPAVAVLWWLAYNLSIYGDPLEFMLGPYSAKVQQQYITDLGLLPTKGNLGLSLSSLNWSLYGIAGVVTLAVSAVGAVVLVATRGLSNRALLVWLTTVAYAFALVSLFLGQTAINNAHTLPSNWWNNRFALTGMIPLALLVGIAISQGRRLRTVGRWLLPALAVALAAQCVWWAQDLEGRSSIMAEARYPASTQTGAFDAAKWLGDHYDGGGVLMDESARGNAILPLAGIPIDQYFNRSAGKVFDAARREPTRYAKWIFVNVERLDTRDGRLALRPDDARALNGTAAPAAGAAGTSPSRSQSQDSATIGSSPPDSGPQDLVAIAIARQPDFTSQYRLAFRSSTHRVYERIGG